MEATDRSSETGTVSRYRVLIRGSMRATKGHGERVLLLRHVFPSSSFYLHASQAEQLFRTIRRLTFTRLSSLAINFATQFFRGYTRKYAQRLETLHALTI